MREKEEQTTRERQVLFKYRLVLTQLTCVLTTHNSHVYSHTQLTHTTHTLSHPGSSGMTGREGGKHTFLRFRFEKRTAQLSPIGKEDKAGSSEWHVHGFRPLTPSVLVRLPNPQTTELCRSVSTDGKHQNDLSDDRPRDNYKCKCGIS
jgi:hypothetical protein